MLIISPHSPFDNFNASTNDKEGRLKGMSQTTEL